MASKTKKTKNAKSGIKHKVVKVVENNPMKIFFIFLGLLLALMFGANYLRSLQTEDAADEFDIVKEVTTFKVGLEPEIVVSGKIVNSSTIELRAQTSGVVNRIYVENGDKLSTGSTILALTSTYSGRNAQTIQREIAEKQYQNRLETNEIQREIVDNQIRQANETNTKLEKLQEIADQSKQDTQQLLDLNLDVLEQIEETIEQLEEGNSDGSNDELIFQNKQLQIQYQSAVNSSRNAIRNLEIQDEDSVDSALADIQKEITLDQLELQKRGLQLSEDISKLQLDLAKLNERLMYPSMPLSGTVEKVHVNQGDLVNPGNLIATVTTDKGDLTVEALVTKQVANRLSVDSISRLEIEDEVFRLNPTYVSSVPTNGSLYSVFYDLSDQAVDTLADGQNINISISLSYSNKGNGEIYIPLETVHLTQEGGFVYLVDGETAVSRQIEIGQITGNFVEVITGVNEGEELILNRNVIDGDKIEKTNNNEE